MTETMTAAAHTDTESCQDAVDQDALSKMIADSVGRGMHPSDRTVELSHQIDRLMGQIRFHDTQGWLVELSPHVAIRLIERARHQPEPRETAHVCWGCCALLKDLRDDIAEVARAMGAIPVGWSAGGD